MTTTQAHDAAAYRLRGDGNTYASIARILGLANANAADTAVQRYCRVNSLSVPGYNPARAQSARRGALRRHGRSVTSARPALTTRRFGVEIEAKGMTRSEVVQVLGQAGIECRDVEYNHRTYSCWKVVYDGSLSGQAVEVVSPPLSGPEGVAEVKAVMDALRESGARIDRECGLHVHHEVIDLTGEEIATLVEMYVGHQATLDSLVAPSRRNAGYARHFHRGEAARFCESFRQIAAPSDAATYGIGGRPESRYRVLNVHSYGLYGTIEFRQHQGTLNGSKTAAWIALGQAMIEAARSQTALRQSHLLADLLAAGHLDQADHDYLTRRAAALA